MRATVERLGAAASVACAVHCAALPILIGAGAGGAVSWLNHRPVEWGLVLLAATVGTVSAWRGFKSHGNLVVASTLVFAALGLVALTAQHSFEAADHAGHDHGLGALSAVFGVALAGSMFVNRRMCRSCTGCDSGHAD